MQERIKKYRIPIPVALTAILVLGVFFNSEAQIKEQLFHDNVIPEHMIPALGPDVFLSAYTFHRSQWTGLSSSPKTTGIGVNYKLSSKFIGQLYYNYDAIQSYDNQQIKIGVVYSLGKDGRIKFGLRSTVNLLSQSQDFVSVDPVDSDPVLIDASQSTSSFDADFSMSYIYNQLSVGLGVSNLLQSGFPSNGINYTRNLSIFIQNQFKVNLFGSRNLMASVFYKAESQSFNAGMFDAKSILFLSPKLGVGAGYRWKESIPFILQYKTTVSNFPLIMQYSYALQTGALSNYNKGSHEISLRINLKTKPIVDTDIDFEERERKSKNVRFL
jgi:type IX secretion system PorP/SprF family membrane protein